MSYTVGLSGIRYNGYFDDNVNWFQTATHHGDTNNLTSIDNFSSNDEYYSWEWIGYFRANSNEAYTFYTDSDDASYLWLGNNAINNYTIENALVNNGGLHGTQEISGTSSVLVSGQYYPIRIQFGENEGGDVITVSFSTDTISKTTDGSGYYFYKDKILNTTNLSGIYLGYNPVNKMYLGNNLVYPRIPISPTPTPTVTSTATPTATPTVTPTPTKTPSAYDYLTLVYDTTKQVNKTVSVPIFGSSPSGVIDWGDNTSSTISIPQFYLHTYAINGTYTVKVSGALDALNYTLSSNTQQNKPKLIECSSFGQLGITNFTNAFANCWNLSTIPNSLPNNATSMDYMFYDTKLNDSKIINYWQSGSMTTMNGIFGLTTAFNQDIGSWNTSNVTSSIRTFFGATAFNQNISSWDMSSNTNMNYMFSGAISFNQNISTWNVSNVQSMVSMFHNASGFNQNLSGWNISGLSSYSGLNNFMRGISLSSSNYDGILSYWGTNKNSYRNDLSPNFGLSKYTPASSGDRQGLINYGWIITDGGLAP